MAKLSQRIARRIKSTASSFRADCRFSPKLALLRACNELGGRVGLRTFSASAGDKKNEWIQDYLKNCLADVLQQFSQDSDLGQYSPDAPIWICWWTGEETASPLVKQCIRSIRKNAGNHPVHLITQDNYSGYLKIPDYILEKVQGGSMCVANFSDYLRFSLLGKYGGLWLDATIFSSAPLESSLFSSPLFTCKGTLGDPSGYLSRYRWTSFCFGGYCNNVLFRYMKTAFEVYWKRNDWAIDYLLVDYLINLAYETLPSCRQLLDAIPENNLHRDDLQAAMNRAASPAEWHNIVQPDTVLYKLSWRETYSLTTPNGQDSIYAYFLTR